ncbi:hypothetical protein FAES_5098 [Fibrella aestuarina BUZ 2]|uniref:Fimbrial protein n=1 Tax=Fibrella aestuarina BUZ 2 TaxID=1166018 RepID=I0KG44_9BACT|nr:hypothetical protein [Fibrella aestuarina]CCH03097.1 hypothetical protein FAES_5098 [Fibrella aestuarina BUZ 2]
MHSSLIATLRTAAFMALVFVGFSAASAQAQTTGTSTMNITVKDVLQLTVNTKTVDLVFATPEDFNKGVSATVNNQLMVTSNRPYELSVKTAGDLTDGTNKIPVSNISAQPVGQGIGSAKLISGLSTTDQVLASDVPPSMSKPITMQYATAAKNEAFLVPASTYTTTLTFTVSAK